MHVQFLQSVANDRGSFRAGQRFDLPRLPRGWDAWLRAGIITIQEPAEVATHDPTIEVASVRRTRGRGRTRRPATMAE